MNTNTYWYFYNHYRVNMEDTAVVPNYEGKGKDCYVKAARGESSSVDFLMEVFLYNHYQHIDCHKII